MHEVLTVQVGSFANHVGANFWNLQDQDRADKANGCKSTLFREGQADNGSPTVLPRLLLFDRAENFGTLRPGGYLYNQKAYDLDAARKVIPWRGQLEVYQTETQDLSSNGLSSQGGWEAPPSTWGDVVRTHYHPRSSVPLKVEEEGVVEWDEAEHGDRLRMFLEECDAPQGLHLLTDLSSPLLPLTSGCVREWHEAAGASGISCFAFCTSPGPQAAQTPTSLLDAIASALAIKDMLQAGALILPLTSHLDGPYARLDGSQVDLTDQTRVSALMACAIETATAPYTDATAVDHRTLMRDWIGGVRGGASSLASLEISTPLSPDLPLPQLTTLLQPSDPRSVLRCPKPQGLLAHLVPLWAPGSGPVAPETPIRRFSSLLSVRGLRRHAPSPIISAVNDAIKYYPWNLPHLTHARPDPLPSAFLGAGPGTAAFYTAAGCTDAVGPYLRSLADALGRRSPKIRAHLAERYGLLDDDLAEVEEVLSTLIEDFEP